VQSLKEISAKFEEHLNIKVESFVITLRRATKADFTSKRIDQVEFLPHDNSTGLFFRLVHLKVRASVRERIAHPVKHGWEDTHLFVEVYLAAIHKSIFLAAVTVKITVQVHFPTLESFSEHLFHCEDLGELLLVWRDILSIKVLAAETASVISNNDTIWIEHWHNFEDVSISQFFSDLVVSK
jgi:hypothetical protein